jgi:hypothetical protein
MRMTEARFRAITHSVPVRFLSTTPAIEAITAPS